MKKAILAGAASLSLTALPGALTAQQTTDATMAETDMEQYSMNTSQQSMYDAWPAERRQAYDSMDGLMQEYYFTLDAQQQETWWLLTDEQRSQLYSLTPQQRTATWASLRQQMSAMRSGNMNNTTTATTGSMANPGMTGQSGAMASPSMSGQTGSMAMNNSGMASGNIRFVSAPVVQNIPMDQATGDVPVCDNNQYDNCMNAYEAGRRGPNVTRPLDSYPGPAGPDD